MEFDVFNKLDNVLKDQDKKKKTEDLTQIAEALTLAQVKLSKMIEDEVAVISGVDTSVKLEELEEGSIKITVKENLPKMKVFRKNINDNIKAYQEVRDRWSSLIKKATDSLSGWIPFEKAIVWIVHYDPYVSDLDNYAFKYIIDALRFLGLIHYKDDFNHLSVIHTGKQDKEDPRTEIYIIMDQGQLSDYYCMNVEKNKKKKGVSFMNQDQQKCQYMDTKKEENYTKNTSKLKQNKQKKSNTS